MFVAGFLADFILAIGIAWLLYQIARSYQGHILLRPTESIGDPWAVHGSRLGVGVVAGFVVALVKYVGTDANYPQTLIAAGWLDLLKLFLGYGLVPMILGAVGGWISDENKVHKIFWVAISAPGAALPPGSRHPSIPIRSRRSARPGRLRRMVESLSDVDGTSSREKQSRYRNRREGSSFQPQDCRTQSRHGGQSRNRVGAAAEELPHETHDRLPQGQW